jgi:uncharacterized membrane protein
MDIAHLHLMLTHGPVAGIVFGTAILTYGYFWSDRRAMDVGMVLFIVTALLASALFVTGEGAEETVEGLAHVAHEAIEAHEEAALYSLIGSWLLAVVAGAGLYLRRRRTLGAGWGRALLLGGVLVTGLIAWTANQGGKISHPGLRSGIAATSEIEEEHED